MSSAKSSASALCIGILGSLVACSHYTPVTYKSVVMDARLVNACTNGEPGKLYEVGEQDSLQDAGQACHSMASWFGPQKEPNEYGRLLKRACELGYAYACRKYVGSATDESSYLNDARQFGEKLCHQSVTADNGKDLTGELCEWVAHNYSDINPKDMAKARYFYERACSVLSYKKACAELSDFGVDTRKLYQAAVEKEQQDREERSQQLRDYENQQRAEHQRSEALVQGLQQLNQSVQGLEKQPSAGFNAPATAGGMASGGETGGTCGSSCLNVECGALKQACQQGGQAACYRATACVCRCHLNKGCSGSQAQMQQCVQDNEAKAQRLQSR